MNPLHNGIFTEKMVCHYTKTQVAIKILKSKRLRFNPLSESNDPRESKEWTFGFGSSEIHCIKEHENDLKKLSKYVSKKSKILCFCGWNDSKMNFEKQAIPFYRESFYRVGWAKSRMWSQYGEGHQGICLVFDKDSLKFEMKRQFQDHLKFSGIVKYCLSPWSFITGRKIDCMKFIINGFEHTIRHQIEKYHEEYYFTKHIDYRDENEFRLVVISDEECPLELPIQDSLRGVIVGIDSPKRTWPVVQKLSIGCNEKAKCGFMSWQNGNPVFWNLWELTGRYKS